ncbi:MAG: phenol meta deg superfamily protein [Flavobacterium sp.]|nr:MAG: phenol meta deg superfamily protein [Flavobacterium sp.]
MKATQNSILLILLFNFFSVSAQYTETINSNRPGFSQGAFSVGKKILQLETGFGYGTEDHRLKNTETNVFLIDYNIRYGVWKEELEVSLTGGFRSENISDKNGTNGDYKVSNFTSNTLGAKYLFFDPYRKKELEKPNLYSWKANNSFHWRDLVPAISIYAGANFDAKDNPLTHIQNNISVIETGIEISPTVAIATQNNWGSWVFVVNIIGDRVTLDEASYSYILTLTHTFNAKMSAFLENQGISSDFYADQIFRGGVAYLFNQDFQIDASILMNFKDTPSRFMGRLGISYRFDMHEKDEYIEDKGKAGREKKKEEKGANKKDEKKKKNKRKDSIDFEDDGDDGSL